MAWAKPNYSRTRVDRAGLTLLDETASLDDVTAALEVLNNWRSSHSFPLNTFQVGLRLKAHSFDQDALIAQRLKRVPSIVQKLKRFPQMSLSRMQDIGGCRAVVHTAGQAWLLREAYRESRIKHILVNEKDYIQNPKESGYRGIHLVYRYRSDKNETYNKNLVEIQIRSQIQHSWATAVETVGIFLDQSLKSSEGPEEWLKFFTLTSSIFAYSEKTTPVQSELSEHDIVEMIKRKADDLRVIEKLRAYGDTLSILDENPDLTAHYYLLTLEPVEGQLTIDSYRSDDLEKATSNYLEKEKEMKDVPGAEVVLVAAESLDALRSAYPNYFLDTEIFLEKLEAIIT